MQQQHRTLSDVSSRTIPQGDFMSGAILIVSVLESSTLFKGSDDDFFFPRKIVAEGTTGTGAVFFVAVSSLL
jgi:hypothetical protein